MDVVNRITSNASTIVTDAARALFEEQPFTDCSWW
jgi:phycocyanin beta chain